MAGRFNFKIIRTFFWLLLVLSFVLTVFHRVALTVVADQITKELNLTALAFGNLTAAYFYMHLLIQLPAGFMVDRISPRTIAMLSTFLVGIGGLIFGGAGSLSAVFLGRLVGGIGGSIVLINIFKFIGLWYEENKIGIMIGTTVMLGNIGAILASSPLALVVEDSGWRWPFLAAGIVGILLSFTIWTFVRSSPDEMGYSLVLTQKSIENNNKNIGLKKSFVLALTNPSIWPPLFVSVGTYGTYMTLVGAWGVTFLMQVYGFSRSIASTYMLLGTLGFMLGSPVIGWISDHVYSRKNPMLIARVIYCFIWLLIIYVSGKNVPPIILYIIMFIFGLSSSGSSLMLLYAKEVSHPSITGLATATANMGLFLGVAIIQPLFGFVLDNYWDGTIVHGVKIYPLLAYQLALGICAAISIASTLLILLMHQTKNKNIYFRLRKIKRQDVLY
ncbi:MAG: MFS transporter [Dehalobacterium sp.]